MVSLTLYLSYHSYLSLWLVFCRGNVLLMMVLVFFSNQTIPFLQQISVKNVHLVSNAGIQTHNLFNLSLLP